MNLLWIYRSMEMIRVLLVLLVLGSGEGRRVRGQRTQTPESFPLDFTAVEGNMESFMTQVKNLAQSLYPCSTQKLDQEMKLQFLRNSSVTCNDGSPAGYYIKESRGSRRWLMFLEGGWYCFSKHTCDSRYETMRRLMSSSKWPSTRTGTGILSSQPEENPHWWNANTVFVPYCSSDVWSGSTAKTDQNEYAFMGSQIIEEVIKELVTKGLDGAKVLLLAGSSAGGTGVLLNVDRVSELLEDLGLGSVQVRGLADSGWFLDHKQYRFTDCIDTISCAPTEAIKRGVRYWNSVVPERCSHVYNGEDWNCFFGYKVQPTLKRPVFVVQWLFDEAQLMVDNVHLTGQPVQEGQWRYIQNLGSELRNTLKNIPAMFAPACLSHEIITRSYWMDIHVKGTSLPRALQCWDRSLRHHGNSSSSIQAPPRGCPLHLIDSCPWPHCNPSCPTIREQMTGQEMSVIQFLTHLGFDVQRVAQQQGMEPHKLLGMLSNGT
ncbi:inactive palmitoleoyl-protein carboxylesterase notum1b isoform X2 [Carassius carassius]|uniref:inactive palmitoleoyl-protein carboxylesterase notum1b isoform X2 n=1 Tax=Carassius carassius TaxID=217509 RepID=UPI0028691AAD|nr:inactive palmitoleoyl-protein carboxylesterase notum1b isoform X2 [Carassius carassius]